MKTYIIDQAGKTIAVIEGTVRIQVTEIPSLDADDSVHEPHITMVLTEEGRITDCFDSGEAIGTSCDSWEDIYFTEEN